MLWFYRMLMLTMMLALIVQNISIQHRVNENTRDIETALIMEALSCTSQQEKDTRGYKFFEAPEFSEEPRWSLVGASMNQYLMIFHL